MYRRMTDAYREIIAKAYNDEGLSVYEIADALQVHYTTVYREINRGMTEELNPRYTRYIYSKEKGRRDAAEARKRMGKMKPGNDGRRRTNAEA